MRALTLAAAFLATLLSAPFAWAGIEPQPFRTGLFGVAAGQAVRISIVNAPSARGIINPCVRVLDAAGTVLFEADAGPLGSGGAAFLDFDPSLTRPAGVPAPRTQVRVEVELVPAVLPGDPDTRRRGHHGAMDLTVEVFNTATGKTAFMMPFATVAGIDPEPFLPVAGVEPEPFRTGLFGVAEGQAIRMNVLNAGDDGGIINPCFHVFDLDGTLLFELEAGPLPAGAGVFTDFNPLPPGPARVPGHRAQVRAELELVPAVFPPDPVATPRVRRDAFHLTLEVFDIATGQTVYTMPVAVGFNPQPEPPEPVR
jgi:hypothetical protein